MQKWEVCRLSGSDATFYSPSGVRRIENRRDKAKGDQNDGDARDRFWVQLLADGWELTSTDWIQGGIGWDMQWFKRPVP